MIIKYQSYDSMKRDFSVATIPSDLSLKVKKKKKNMLKLFDPKKSFLIKQTESLNMYVFEKTNKKIEKLPINHGSIDVGSKWQNHTRLLNFFVQNHSEKKNIYYIFEMSKLNQIKSKVGQYLGQ